MKHHNACFSRNEHSAVMDYASGPPVLHLFTIVCSGLTHSHKLVSIMLLWFAGSLRDSEAQNVQEVAFERPHTNAPHLGACHRPARGSLDGLQHLEPEAHSARQSHRSRHPARL